MLLLVWPTLKAVGLLAFKAFRHLLPALPGALPGNVNHRQVIQKDCPRAFQGSKLAYYHTSRA